MTDSVGQKSSISPDVLCIVKKYNLSFGKRSVFYEDDDGWIFKKETVFNYFERAITEDGKWADNLRYFLFNDPNYIRWSDDHLMRTGPYGERACVPNLNSHKVLRWGVNFENWKDGKVFVCKSFHLLKQIYDRIKKREGKEWVKAEDELLSSLLASEKQNIVTSRSKKSAKKPVARWYQLTVKLLKVAEQNCKTIAPQSIENLSQRVDLKIDGTDRNLGHDHTNHFWAYRNLFKKIVKDMEE